MRRLAGPEHLQTTLEEADDERVPRHRRSTEIGERRGEILSCPSAERLAGAKPDQRVVAETFSQRVQARSQGVPFTERVRIEHLAIDEDAPPTCRAPKTALPQSVFPARTRRANRGRSRSFALRMRRRGARDRGTSTIPPATRARAQRAFSRAESRRIPSAEAPSARPNHSFEPAGPAPLAIKSLRRHLPREMSRLDARLLRCAALGVDGQSCPDLERSLPVERGRGSGEAARPWAISHTGSW